MGNMVQHLGNTTSVTSMHHLRNLWNSPRGTVLRIQALAVVAIVITFFLAAFGSCRRWSNRWIVQKGFFAAQVLSLSLGTYSIGLMQSSSVKSEMYPIWTVSLFTLFGCIDPVTTYNGLEYKGPLSKVVFGIFLNCGYVLLMSISTISSVVGNTAIGGLAAITFIKGFHRSLALMQQRRMRNNVQTLLDGLGHAYVLENDPKKCIFERDSMKVSFDTGINGKSVLVNLSQIEDALVANKQDKRLQSCYELCLAMSLSHHLQRYFLGLDYRNTDPGTLKNIDYKWALKVIEIELAFVYDVFFTGNPFLHYYQAKTASLWAFASFIGICYVGVAAAIPGTMSSRHTASDPGDCTNIVGTTTGDLVITFIILVSLALLQLMHLIRCWTSNWARVAVACAYAVQRQMEIWNSGQYKTSYWRAWWMGFKAFVATSSNWFDKHLWQDKIGQYSVLPEGRLIWGKKDEGSSRIECKTQFNRLTSLVHHIYQKCSHRLVKVLGLDYIGEVLWDLLGSDTNRITAVRLDDDVKGYIIDFLRQIETDRVDGTWLSFGIEHSINLSLPLGDDSSPKEGPQKKNKNKKKQKQKQKQKNSAKEEVHLHGYKYSKCIMEWHIVTWYCELKEQWLEKQDALSGGETAPSFFKNAAAAITGFKKEAAGGGERKENQNRRVANALSKYCAYLVVSAPDLLPSPAPATKLAYEELAKAARLVLDEDKETFLGALSDPGSSTDLVPSWIEQLHRIQEQLEASTDDGSTGPASFTGHKAKEEIRDAFRVARQLLSKDPWETLALVWVRILVCAAPYGNVEAHMRHLQHGGEFITHIWALLYHLDIRKWKLLKYPLNIITIDDAEIIIALEDQAVVAFLDSSGSYNDELAAASKLEDGISFYQTTSVDVAKLFNIDPAAKRPCLALLKKQEDSNSFTIYDGPFRAYAIADFLSVNKKRQTDKDESDEQSEDESDEQSEDEIEMEIPQQS